jgi:subtilase family serine protease
MKTNKLSLISLVCLVFFIAITLSGCVNLEVLSEKLDEITVKTPNEEGVLEDDYAIKYTVQVRNKGTAGKVRAIAKLYSPGGQFYREQIVNVGTDEVKTFEFIFTEPTISVALFGRDKVKVSFRYESVK